VAVAQFRVQPLARLGDEAEERMPRDLARVAATRALPRASRAVVFDQRRVNVESHLLTLDERVDAGEELVEGAVELAEVAKPEAAQETPERGRVGEAVPAQRRLRFIRAQERCVVKTLAADDQRLAEGERRLRGAIAALALLDRDRVDQLRDAEASEELAHEHEPRLSRDLLSRGRDLDQRR
jgi:hypothetical protein